MDPLLFDRTGAHHVGGIGGPREEQVRMVRPMGHDHCHQRLGDVVQHASGGPWIQKAVTEYNVGSRFDGLACIVGVLPLRPWIRTRCHSVQALLPKRLGAAVGTRLTHDLRKAVAPMGGGGPEQVVAHPTDGVRDQVQPLIAAEPAPCVHHVRSSAAMAVLRCMLGAGHVLRIHLLPGCGTPSCFQSTGCTVWFRPPVVTPLVT
mmetsp:Transcript_51012/g.91254  ORF Transcript_51012/g.91254 Transcript_51012/m.91254 type:complete len:204 (-) Transcript_51012:1311-1922(-)